MPTQILTDRQKVEQFLRSLDIEFQSCPSFIRLKEGANKVGGYPNHETIFEFDKDGKFLEVGAYR